MEPGKEVHATEVIRSNSYESYVRFLFLFNERFLYKKKKYPIWDKLVEVILLSSSFNLKRWSAASLQRVLQLLFLFHPPSQHGCCI